LKRSHARSTISDSHASSVGASSGDADVIGGARVSDVHEVLASLVGADELVSGHAVRVGGAGGIVVVDLAGLVDAVEAISATSSVGFAAGIRVDAGIVVSHASVFFSRAGVGGVATEGQRDLGGGGGRIEKVVKESASAHGERNHSQCKKEKQCKLHCVFFVEYKKKGEVFI